MVDIILTYYSSDFLLDKCISQLLKTLYPDFTINIVDNTLCSEQALRRFDDPRINIIKGVPCRTSTGYSRGRQHPQGITHGINQTSGKYIALLEADCWPLQPEWLAFCIEKLKTGIGLVGIQDPGSIPITFQVYERSKLGQYPSFSYLNKPAYCPEDLAYVTHPEVITRSRHKWRYGEYLPVLMHKNKEKTWGLLPTKVCSPWEIKLNNWLDAFEPSLGLIYGDLIFHCNKSFRKADTIKSNMDFFLSDKYLTSTLSPPKSNTRQSIINDGCYDNSIYIS